MYDSENDDALDDEDNSLPRQEVDRYGFYGGKQFTDPEMECTIPLDVLRSREQKWRKMCANWEFWYMGNFQKLRDRCRKGIPDSFRGEAWQRLCMSPMVLVQRQKIYCSDVPVLDSQPKSRFSTLSRKTNTKSLHSVITSPSFRVTKVKEEERRNLLYLKVHGTPLHVSARRSSFLSLRSTRFDDNVTALRENYNHSTMLPFAIPSSIKREQNKPLNLQHNTSLYQIDAKTTCPGGSDNMRTTEHTVGDNFSTLPNSIKNAVLSNFDEAKSNYSTYNTLASVHEKSNSPEPQIFPTGITVETSATRSSGGYASLSTASATDSTGTNNLQNEIPALGVSSTDSCASFLMSAPSSSSVTSSTSVLSHPIINMDQPFCNGFNNNDDDDDARATLVPTLDPDPEKMYAYYCAQSGSATDCEQIRRDIDRQFPFHELFEKKGGHGQESLYTLLKSYTIRYPDKGYCQGQAPLAAVLLMYMPELDAFWTFCEICERYLSCYYDAGLERIQIDGGILYAILDTIYPSVYRYLRKHQVDPILVVVEWFMCVYTRTLPWITVLRVLDMFLCEGKVILFKVAVVLLYRLFGKRNQRKSFQGLDEILMRLREVSSVVNNLEDFIRDVTRVKLTPKDLSQFIIKESNKWAELHKE